MHIYFLGTGTSQGIPVIGSNHPVCLSNDIRDKRLRVSVWVKYNNYSFVIDCGPDFRQQMLTSGCTKLDAIFFTHEHADHTSGLDDIRPFNFMQNEPITIYGHLRVLNELKSRFEYIFKQENRYPGSPSVNALEVKNNESIYFENLTITPINADHGGTQVFGYRFNDFVYLTDVKSIENSEIQKVKSAKVLVINALREESHHSHFSLKEAIDFIHLVQPEKAFLTHISHLLGFHEEIEAKLPKNVFLAYDNLTLNI
jgi:phosphoribosyl 1,2-cyclic phosphate phosphodiesterase